LGTGKVYFGALILNDELSFFPGSING